MSIFQIPLTNNPQSFQIALGGVEYLMTCRFNDADDAGWLIDIADLNTSLPIIANIPLVTGINLLAGLQYLGINGVLFVYTDGSPTAVPTFDNLGVESNLYFQTDVDDG